MNLFKKDENKLSRKEQKRVDKLLRQVPEKFSGANAFLSVLKYFGVGFGVTAILFPLF